MREKRADEDAILRSKYDLLIELEKEERRGERLGISNRVLGDREGGFKVVVRVRIATVAENREGEGFPPRLAPGGEIRRLRTSTAPATTQRRSHRWVKKKLPPLASPTSNSRRWRARRRRVDRAQGQSES